MGTKRTLIALGAGFVLASASCVFVPWVMACLAGLLAIAMIVSLVGSAPWPRVVARDLLLLGLASGCMIVGFIVGWETRESDAAEQAQQRANAAAQTRQNALTISQQAESARIAGLRQLIPDASEAANANLQTARAALSTQEYAGALRAAQQGVQELAFVRTMPAESAEPLSLLSQLDVIATEAQQHVALLEQLEFAAQVLEDEYGDDLDAHTTFVTVRATLDAASPAVVAAHAERHGELVQRLADAAERVQRTAGRLRIQRREAHVRRAQLQQRCGVNPPHRGYISTWLRQSLHNPDSFSFESCSEPRRDGSRCWVATCSWRGENAFGAIRAQTATVHFDANGLTSIE